MSFHTLARTTLTTFHTLVALLTHSARTALAFHALAFHALAMFSTLTLLTALAGRVLFE